MLAEACSSVATDFRDACGDCIAGGAPQRLAADGTASCGWSSCSRSAPLDWTQTLSELKRLVPSLDPDVSRRFVDREAAGVQALLGRLSLRERIGQMLQLDVNLALATGEDITAVLDGSLDKSAGAGAVVFAGALAARRLATVLPHNIGLGAADDESLTAAAGAATATEVAAAGLNWAFGPCVASPRDSRWGRTYEGFGADEQLGDADLDAVGLAEHLLPYRAAVQACGRGACGRRGLQAGVLSVMVSYSSGRLQAAVGRLSDPPPPARDSVGFLKEHLGFGGLVVSDLGGVDQLRGGSLTRFAAAINAGVDMVMLPGALRLLAPIASTWTAGGAASVSWQTFLDDVERAVLSGEVPRARVDDAAARVLAAAIGLVSPFGDPAPEVEADSERGFGSRGPWAHATGREEGGEAAGGEGGEAAPTDDELYAAHSPLAEEAARRSAVLLEQSGAPPLLPLPREARLLLACSGAHSLERQLGGWSLGWQGAGEGARTKGTTVLRGLLRRSACADPRSCVQLVPTPLIRSPSEP
ncbi:hypothetical protein EMIHUDRAFT_239718, partial [Emiliania huxleyi CCMP1516]